MGEGQPGSKQAGKRTTSGQESAGEAADFECQRGWGEHNEKSVWGGGKGGAVLLTRRQRVAEDSVDTTVFSHLVCSTGCPAKKGFGGDYPGRVVVMVLCEGALVLESGG